jgi:hypothetical protein
MGKVISFANFQNSSGKITFIIETAKTLQRSGKTSILMEEALLYTKLKRSPIWKKYDFTKKPT